MKNEILFWYKIKKRNFIGWLLDINNMIIIMFIILTIILLLLSVSTTIITFKFIEYL